MIKTYRVMRGFALNYGEYGDVQPGNPETVDLPEQVARPYLMRGKLIERTGQTGTPREANTGHIINPDVIVTRDPIPAKIAAGGGGKRRK